MFKYQLYALMFKAFSSTNVTKNLYRYAAQTLGSRLRVQRGLQPYHIESGMMFIDIFRKHNIVSDKMKLIDFGTGWMHWYAVFVRLFYDVTITLFDNNDNRQFKPLMKFINDLKDNLHKIQGISSKERSCIRDLIEKIIKVNSFDQLYRLLNFEYIVDDSDSFNSVKDKSVDVIFSQAVLEHLRQENIPKILSGMHRVLKASGYCVHLIDMGDHISYFDCTVAYKNYLKYSDDHWRRYYESNIQYFNRVQKSEWLDYFKNGNFRKIDEISTYGQNTFPVNSKYRMMSKDDLECKTLLTVHQKM